MLLYAALDDILAETRGHSRGAVTVRKNDADWGDKKTVLAFHICVCACEVGVGKHREDMGEGKGQQMH